MPRGLRDSASSVEIPPHDAETRWIDLEALDQRQEDSTSSSLVINPRCGLC
ncbi:Uncharacterised protein [Pseudomonas aeruginosa]|nr:Uncharacterised protein [Pseudomonas aeruginosa]